MFFRLSGDYALRGWEKLNAVLVRRPYNQTRILTKSEFSLLMLCDGETESDSWPLTEEECVILNRFKREHVLESCETPTPLDPWQQYRFYPNRYVESCFWSVTGRCNYRCRHCFMDAPEGVLGEITHEEAMSLIDQMAACGVLRVDFTGGEPFVRSDLWTLIDRMQACGIQLDMFYTNGHLLTDAALDAFELRGLKPRFSISFDGLGQHDWMRGVDGAEQAALAAIERCVRRGFYVNVEMCLHRGNLPVLRQTLKKLGSMGVGDVKCSAVAPTPLWLKHEEGNALSCGEYFDRLLEYIPEYFEDGKPVSLVLCDLAVLYRDRDAYEVVAEKHCGTEDALNAHLCSAARSACYIAPDGRLLPCMPMTACTEAAVFPKVQQIGLREGLNKSTYMHFVDARLEDLLSMNKTCRSCAYKLVCGGGCRATAIEQTGSLWGTDPIQCFLWQNGYIERTHQVIDTCIAQRKGKKEETNA